MWRGDFKGEMDAQAVLLSDNIRQSFPNLPILRAVCFMRDIPSMPGVLVADASRD
jgi:hypothetical protein